MKFQEKIEKALKNMKHLGLELTDINTEFKPTTLVNAFPEKEYQLSFIDKDKEYAIRTLDFFANFGWCPYCNEALGDEPFCSQCGEVSGAPQKFYEYGVIRKHFRFECVEYYIGSEKCESWFTGRSFTENEIRKNFSYLETWDGSVKQLNKSVKEQSLFNDYYVFKEIDEWEE